MRYRLGIFKLNEGDLIGNGGFEKKSVFLENMCFFLMKII